MRVNIYGEELTDRIEMVTKVVDGITFHGVRFYLELPVSIGDGSDQVSGPFIHRAGDDDSSAVTFWHDNLGALASILSDAHDLIEREIRPTAVQA